jgi:hypothetical protein
MEQWRTMPAFLSPQRCAHFEEQIAAQRHRFVSVAQPLRLGPTYRTLRGEDICRYLPEIVDFGATTIQPLVESFAGRPLRNALNPGRAVRLQLFDDRSHRVRWHFDTSSVAALLTLHNDNGSETQIITPSWSRRARPFYYPLFWGRPLFSLLPRSTVVSGTGDLLLMHGAQLLHRGVPTSTGGDRLLLVFAYEDPDRRPTPWREKFNKYMNTGYASAARAESTDR